MFYRLYVPKQAVGASLKYFDLFNATGSAAQVEIYSVLPIVSGAVAVTGLLGVDLFLQRTTDVGTGGTAATADGSDQTACTISKMNHNQPLSASITARLTPSGGATAGAIMGWRSVFTEETNAATYMVTQEMARSHYQDIPPIYVLEGSGIAVIQGSVASVGNIGFSVVFRAKPIVK